MSARTENSAEAVFQCSEVHLVGGMWCCPTDMTRRLWETLGYRLLSLFTIFPPLKESCWQLLYCTATVSPDIRLPTSGLQVEHERAAWSPERGNTLALLKPMKMTQCPTSIVVFGAERTIETLSLGTLVPNLSLQWSRECAKQERGGMWAPHRPNKAMNNSQCTNHIMFLNQTWQMHHYWRSKSMWLMHLGPSACR